MNKKYLFGMLLSGALLAACTADDALEAAKVANKGEMAAPVFTVSLDNGDLQNRSEFVENGWKVKFEKDDKLSLFHGIKNDGDAENPVPTKDLNEWQNAIYLAKGDANSDGGLEFSTQSMVQRGFAIMVFPADETFDQMGDGTVGENAPIIKINAVQKAEDKDKTPYISEFLFLDDDDDTDYEKAGYGKDYDVALKRAAGTLTLKLHNENEPEVADADPLEIRAIEVAYPTAVFPLKLKVNAIDLDGKFEEDHPSWAYGSGLNLEDVGEEEGEDVSKSLKTKDVVDNETATFTILPWYAPTVNAQAKNGTVKVYTNYGIATISTADDEVFGQNLDQKLDAIIDKIADGLYGINTNSKYFKGEYTGKHATTHMGVDLSKLEINGMHVDNTKDLNNLLKVFEAGKCTEYDVITLYLDGDEDNENFTMDYETWQRVASHMAEGDVKFVPCNGSASASGDAACAEEAPCTKVTLQAPASGSAEVPAMKFEGSSSIQVDLAAGNWTYKSKTAGDNGAKVIEGVATIHVTSGATLTPSDFIAVKGTNKATSLKLVVDNGGKMTVSSKVTVQVDVENQGTIDITSSGNLTVGKDGAASNGEKTLLNWAEPYKKTDVKTHGGNRKCGVINNAGTLVVQGQSATGDGKIENRGLINVEEGAVTGITTNASASANFGQAYGGTSTGDENQLGTVVLPSVDGDGLFDIYNKSVNKGFVKYTINKETPAISDFVGEHGTVANYIILGSSCKNLKYAEGGNPKAATNLPAYEPGEEVIDYIEITSNVVFSGTYKLKGLIVPANKQFTVTNDGELGVTEGISNMGTVVVLGTLNNGASSSATAATVTNYLGKSTGEISGKGYTN